MDDILTYNNLVEFPKDFKNRTEQYQDIAELISKAECSNYNFITIKEYIDKRIQKFKDARYIYKYPDEKYYTSVTSNNVPREGMCQRKNISKQESNIQKYNDELIWVNYFYNMFMEDIATKLTSEESVYFIYTYFRKYSEDVISANLGICKQTLQNIKKSCLLKIYIEMKALEELED